MKRDRTLAVVLGLIAVAAIVVVVTYWVMNRNGEGTVHEENGDEALPTFDLTEAGRTATGVHFRVMLPGAAEQDAYQMTITGKEGKVIAIITHRSLRRARTIGLSDAWIETLNAAVRSALAGEPQATAGIAVALQWEPWVDEARVRKDLAFHLDAASDAGKALSEILAQLELREYTVRKNDTLSKIALKYLGNAGRWREIQKVNPGLTEDIRVGQRIKLPPR